MSGRITNEVLCERIESLHALVKLQFETNTEAHNQVNAHLKQLNGQVIKNTRFRWQVLAYVPLVVVLIELVLRELIN